MDKLLITRLAYYNQSLAAESKTLEGLLDAMPLDENNIMLSIERLLYFASLIENADY
jgi:hypothetical protein